MSKIGEKVKHELAELIPVTLFFFVAFQLLAVTQMLMLEEVGMRKWVFVAATVGALIVAKVVAIADHLPFLNRFPEHPLIYNVAWKTAIYFLASLAVRYAEHVIRAWRKFGGFLEANRQLVHEIHWPHLIVVQLWLLILLLVYCTLRELVRALGRDRVFALFLTNRAAAYPGGKIADHSS